jgi:hypothetical protein
MVSSEKEKEKGKELERKGRFGNRRPRSQGGGIMRSGERRVARLRALIGVGEVEWKGVRIALVVAERCARKKMLLPVEGMS